jgi:hypothetical protein
MMLRLSLQNIEVDKKVQPQTESIGSYRCRYCGERHASDDQELWCMMATNSKDRLNNH